jgi:hypothetical protein
LLLFDRILSLQLLVLTIDDRSGSQLQIFLHNVGAWMEICHGKGLCYVTEWWILHLASPKFHLLSTGVKSLKKGLIVVHYEVIFTPDRTVVIFLARMKGTISKCSCLFQAILNHR